MKTTIKKIALVVFVLSFAHSGLKAQANLEPTSDYKNAIGLRAGETAGLTYKHRFANSNAFEAIVGIWPYTIGFTGLYEKYVSAGVSGLNWYFGGGGHVNVGPERYRVYYWNDGSQYVYVKNASEVSMGIDGVGGIEYKFKPVPIAISADIKPYVEISNYGFTYFTIDPSIGIKFAF